MSERRRMIYNKPEQITDGLQFWFDGKNNLQGGGYSKSATTWYPYMKNSNVPNTFKLSKASGSNTWQNNGGITNLFMKSGSPGIFYYLPTIDSFSCIICVNCTPTSSINSFCPIGNTYNGGNGTNRGGLYIYDGCFSIRGDFGSSWTTYKGTKSIVNLAIKTLTWVRSGGTMYCYVNGNLFDSFSCTSNSLYKDHSSDFTLGKYEESNNFIPGTYYSAQFYNRVLSSNEIAQVHRYLTARYGI